MIRLIIPPLRERPEDILFLFGHVHQLMRVYRDGSEEAFRSGAETTGAPFELDPREPLPAQVAAAVAQAEDAYVRACLRRHDGRIADSADAAGISRRTLLRKLRQYGIAKREYKV